MKKKMLNKKGFTLVEMLTCILTLTLLTGICSMGMNFAMKVYRESMFESESQMLKSTLELSLNDILRYATDVKTETPSEGATEAKVTGFTNRSYQITGGMIILNDNKFAVKNLPAEGTAGYKVYLIASNQVYGEYLYIDGFELVYDTATSCFSGKYKIKSTVVEDVEKECTFTCRTISE